MTTGNATSTNVTLKSRSVIEDASAKVLDSIGCKNIFTQDLFFELFYIYIVLFVALPNSMIQSSFFNAI